jgi:hypothetical protein
MDWAVPFAGITVFVLGRVVGELSLGHTFLAAIAALVGTAALLFPASMFALDAPRRWFAGSRPGPSRSYLWSSRIAGAILLAGGIAMVLLW